MKEVETELKLAYRTREELLAIPDEEWFRKYLLPDAPVRQELTSSYLDTPDMKLAVNGAVVRVREVENDDYIHTVKISSGGNDGLHQRFEWNHKTQEDRFSAAVFLEHAKTADDPYSLLDSVLSPIVDEELKCILQTKFTRISYLSGFGDSILEVSLDFGFILAGDNKSEICEMEIELLEGDVRDLLAFGEIVLTGSSGFPEVRSKYGRGMDLLRASGEL